MLKHTATQRNATMEVESGMESLNSSEASSRGKQAVDRSIV
jgi:hypothetical protein